MKTTENVERPSTDVECLDNHPRKEVRDPAKEISEQMATYHLMPSAPLDEWTSRHYEFEHDPVMRIWEVYQKEVDESEGFDVGDYHAKLPGFTGLTVPCTSSKDELADRFNGYAKSAIKRYNKKLGAKFKVVEIEKANWSCPGSYFITFTASEENDEPKVFQAKVVRPIKGDPAVHLCRQKGDRLGGYMNDEYAKRGRRSS